MKQVPATSRAWIKHFTFWRQPFTNRAKASNVKWDLRSTIDQLEEMHQDYISISFNINKKITQALVSGKKGIFLYQKQVPVENKQLELVKWKSARFSYWLLLSNLRLWNNFKLDDIHFLYLRQFLDDLVQTPINIYKHAYTVVIYIKVIKLWIFLFLASLKVKTLQWQRFLFVVKATLETNARGRIEHRQFSRYSASLRSRSPNEHRDPLNNSRYR